MQPTTIVYQNHLDFKRCLFKTTPTNPCNRATQLPPEVFSFIIQRVGALTPTLQRGNERMVCQHRFAAGPIVISVELA